MNILNRIIVFVSFVSMAPAVFSASIRYEIHHGHISEEHIQELIPHDIELFYDYPYLFVENPQGSQEFLQSLSTLTTIIVLAYDTNKLIGAVIAYSLDEHRGRGHFDIVSQYHGYRPGHNLYIAWLAVAKQYQRRGVARQLVRNCEMAACERGYTDAYLFTVVRSNEHPFKPADAPDFDGISTRLEFRMIQLYKLLNWPTRCGIPGDECVALIDNMVQYWHKELKPSFPTP